MKNNIIGTINKRMQFFVDKIYEETTKNKEKLCKLKQIR